MSIKELIKEYDDLILHLQKIIEEANQKMDKITELKDNIQSQIELTNINDL